MASNIELIKLIIDYIEKNIEEEIDLDSLSLAFGYSKYHLHRIFTGVIGISLHNYIKRRQLTEAARKLIFSQKAILEIAMDSGYDSQQSFSNSFKKLYKNSPSKFRKRKQFNPIQLKFNVDENLLNLKGDRIIDIEIVERGETKFIGYKASTKRGLFIIPKLWSKLHKIKNQIKNRLDEDFIVGINNYTNYVSYEDTKIVFDYFAAVEVNNYKEIPHDMVYLTIPKSRYIVFVYRGKAKESMLPIMDYIYKDWFSKSNSRFNSKIKIDFVRYGEKLDEKGDSRIEVWIPII